MGGVAANLVGTLLANRHDRESRFQERQIDASGAFLEIVAELRTALQAAYLETRRFHSAPAPPPSEQFASASEDADEQSQVQSLRVEIAAAKAEGVWWERRVEVVGYTRAAQDVILAAITPATRIAIVFPDSSVAEAAFGVISAANDTIKVIEEAESKLAQPPDDALSAYGTAERSFANAVRKFIHPKTKVFWIE